MTLVVDHMESYLGLIAGGYRTPDEPGADFQIVHFAPDSPRPGLTTMATLGLSRHFLALDEPDEGEGSHQELVLHLPTADLPRSAAAVLWQIGLEMLDQQRGIARGQWIGPRGQVFGVGELTALYATVPSLLPGPFRLCESETGPVTMTWLVPIATAEAEFATARGWSELEAAFADEDVDLTDLHRRPLASAGATV